MDLIIMKCLRKGVNEVIWVNGPEEVRLMCLLIIVWIGVLISHTKLLMALIAIESDFAYWRLIPQNIISATNTPSIAI